MVLKSLQPIEVTHIIKEARMTKCKQGKQETAKCDICLSWMHWDCSLVNEEQQIYVEKSEDVHGLFGHAKHALLIS